LDLPFDIGTAAADIATSFLGSRYSWGGSSPSTGFDCSGLIQHSYDQVGIKLPRTAKEMERVGEEVTLSDVRPGDIICTTGSG
jgi:cell wall-associated NlpC family hydrolase